MTYHTIIIVGNLGKEPEMRYTPGGTPVTNFNVATNRVYSDSDGNQVKETTWFRVSAWGKQAETCNQYLSKGSQVLIEGRLIPDPDTGSPRTYQRQDGTAGSSFEVHANTVRFLSGRGDTEGGYQGKDNNSEDIPF